MEYRLDHVAISCKDLPESIRFYETLFDGKATTIRKGSAGYAFCFIQINGSAAVQLMESKGQVGVHHYGFIADDIEQVSKIFKEKGVQIIRENRDPSGKLTTIFLKDPNGLEIEVRLPR